MNKIHQLGETNVWSFWTQIQTADGVWGRGLTAHRDLRRSHLFNLLSDGSLNEFILGMFLIFFCSISRVLTIVFDILLVAFDFMQITRGRFVLSCIRFFIIFMLRWNKYIYIFHFIHL